jgi:putative FmdB family regulatory protein
MPVYEYRCPSCDIVFDFEHGMRDKPAIHCPECGMDAVRVYTPSGMILKGSGFFNTDYKGNGEHAKDPRKTRPTDGTKHSDDSTSADKDTSTQGTGVKDTTAPKTPACPAASSACQACPAAN